MKKFRVLCWIALVVIVLIFIFRFPERVSVRVAYEDLGIPSSAQYETGVRARSPWDLTVWDGYLYVGSGDFDANAGPVTIWRKPLKQGEWEGSEPIPEEEIDRFCIVDGKLTVPGIDPQESWEFGNYYVLQDGEWVKNRVLPDGVHTFDIVSYHGMIFAGLGVEEGKYPVVVSEDGGETFRHMELYQNGEPLDTSTREIIRIYNFFTYNDDLYAFFIFRSSTKATMEIYRYAEGRFEFSNYWNGKIKIKSIAYLPILAKTEYNGKYFFATGNLYYTEDMENVTQIPFPNSETVYDLIQQNGKIYALCGLTQEDGSVRVSVWSNSKSNDAEFKELFYFEYPVPPLSLALWKNTYYIGMANTPEDNDLNGTILQIDFRK
ncbi:MAG: hypothetical protein J5958_06855 [Clostridia bacterium]|nr:hypothetical protein [Clostridia bacterium]